MEILAFLAAERALVLAQAADLAYQAREEAAPQRGGPIIFAGEEP
jgi:hypothetical protein